MHDGPNFNEMRAEGLADAAYVIEASGGPHRGPRPTEDPYEIARVLHHVNEPIARRIGELLDADWSGMRELWVERMTDLDGWCVRNTDYPYFATKYLDPNYVDGMIKGRQRSLDPSDPDTIRVKRWLSAGALGATTVEVVDIDTREHVRTYETSPGPPSGAAPLN